MWEASFRYYEPRCGHGSSLSRSMHAIVAARLGDVALAEQYFHETAATDLSDTRGGSAGGVRIAALGGLWQAAVFGFFGLSLRPDGVALDPRLPASWRRVGFRVQWRGRTLRLALDGERRALQATIEVGEPMAVHVAGRRHRLEPGRPLDVDWVAVSHEHLDHMDLSTLRRLPTRTRVLIPRYAAPTFRDRRRRADVYAKWPSHTNAVAR